MQFFFAICLEASRYAMLELGLPNVRSHYAKLTAQGFFTWGEMPLKACVNVIFVIFSEISLDLIQNRVTLSKSL